MNSATVIANASAGSAQPISGDQAPRQPRAEEPVDEEPEQRQRGDERERAHRQPFSS